MSRGQEMGWSGGSERCSAVVRGRGGSIRASCLGEEAEKTIV